MRKLLVLIAFILMIYYVRASVAAPAPLSKAWVTCANIEVQLEVAKARDRQADFMHDLCQFYDKPQAECYKILEESSKEQVAQIIGQYYHYGVAIPKCGNPK